MPWHFRPAASPPHPPPPSPCHQSTSSASMLGTSTATPPGHGHTHQLQARPAAVRVGQPYLVQWVLIKQLGTDSDAVVKLALAKAGLCKEHGVQLASDWMARARDGCAATCTWTHTSERHRDLRSPLPCPVCHDFAFPKATSRGVDSCARHEAQSRQAPNFHCRCVVQIMLHRQTCNHQQDRI